jgi:FkbM family methyltransferase
MGFSLRRYIVAQLSRHEAGVGQYDWKRLRFSYAQYGEDIIAEAFLPAPKGFYVEVGAYHPIQLSNTYLFYRKGWRGIAVDPNPRVAPAFRRKRPGDIVLQYAVGESEGKAIFDIMGSGGETDHLRGAGIESDSSRRPVRSIEVQCRRLSSLLDDHLQPVRTIDFLSVDAEGHDLSVLRSNDWKKYRARLVAVEDFQSETESSICRFFRDQGYRLAITSAFTRFFVPADGS